MAAKSEERLPADSTAKFKVKKNGRKAKLVAKENNHENSHGKRHIENSSTKFEAKENNHQNKRSKRHSENSSTKPVAKENNRENSRGKRQSENSSTEPVSEENNRPEWLPDGWVVDLRTRKSGSAMGQHYKVFIEPLTGCKFFSMPEVLRHLESLKNRNSECERKTTHAERSKCVDAQKVLTKTERKVTKTVVVEKPAVDDLPPGWIKETKTKKTACGNRKDLPLPDAKSQKLEHTATRRRLFPVKASSDVCSPTVSNAEVLRKRRGKDVSAETDLTGAPTAEISPEKMVKMAIKKDAETKEISSLSGSALPKFRDSKINQGKMVFADNGSVSTPISDSLQGQRLLESHIECSNGKTLNDTTKSAKKKKLNLPLRSSKRLAGLEPEPVSNSVTIEQAHENVAAESCKSKALASAGLTSTFVVDEVSQHLKASSEPELANHVSSDINPSREKPSNNKSSGSQAIPGEQLQKFKSAEASGNKSEQHVSMYFGDTYLDPCLESAFKALMGELPVNSNPDNGSVLNPAADILQDTSMQTTEGEKRSSRKTQINSVRSRNKQELNFPRRSSKRLSGFEPELVANCESLEQAPKNVTTESCKSKGILPAGSTSSGLVDEVSPQHKAGPVLGLLNRASEVLGLVKCVSSEVNIPSSGEPSNKIKSSGNIYIKGGQPTEANDDKSEPHVSLSVGGSYSHPYKDMMGETLVDSVRNEPVSTTAADILPEKKLQETKVGKRSNKKTDIKSIKSKNKLELNLPRRSSKRLAGIEADLVSHTVSGEQNCGNANIESCKSEAPTCEKTDPHGPAEGASLQVEVGHETIEVGHETIEVGYETMFAQHDCTDIGTQLLEKSSDESNKPLELEAQTVSEEPSQKLENEKAEEQPQKLEVEKTDIENPDSQILFPFGDSWSDPCLEFAFKTLTGAIPVDENLAIQDYLQHQLDPSNSQKDDSSALPDFGPISSFQIDVSHPFDAPEKQPDPTQQQLPTNSFLPPGNVSKPNCSSIDLNNQA